MSKSEVMMTLKEQKIVVVVRGNTVEEGINTAKSCIKGGLLAIEVAYSNPKASTIIEQLSSDYRSQKDVVIGAGTVLDATTARLAILSGAQFVVSPAFDKDVATVCHLYNVPYIPGCLTITEITTALAAGCEMIKLFPGSVVSPNYISAVKAPLPQVEIMVTGGVNLENAQQWFNSGVQAIGIGGEFNKLAQKGQFDAIKKMAEDYVALKK